MLKIQRRLAAPHSEFGRWFAHGVAELIYYDCIFCTLECRAKTDQIQEEFGFHIYCGVIFYENTSKSFIDFHLMTYHNLMTIYLNQLFYWTCRNAFSNSVISFAFMKWNFSHFPGPFNSPESGFIRQKQYKISLFHFKLSVFRIRVNILAIFSGAQ